MPLNPSNRVLSTFSELRAQSRRGLMPFVVGGHPSRGEFSAALGGLEKAGASIIEVGIPFSDPIADGPVIAGAMHTALGAGVTPQSVFDDVRSIRDFLRPALVAMVSFSIVHKMGASAAGGSANSAGGGFNQGSSTNPHTFAKRAAEAGFDGLIVPDCPLEESTLLAEAARDHNLTLSLLISPTTPPARAAQIAAKCTGFVYLLARTGITGTTNAPQGTPSAPSQAPALSLRQRIDQLRAVTDLPIACGFGIATADDVRAVVREGNADAAIVGSALVQRLSAAKAQGRDIGQEAQRFCESLASGL